MGSWSFRAPSANLAALVLGAVALLGAAPTGALFVTTLPAGADVWLDGTYVGHAPVVLDALAVGTHHLTLTRTGWMPDDETVAVAAAQTLTASVVLVRDGKTPESTGTIVIHAGGRIGAVAIDGQPAVASKDGAFAANAGTHEVAITSPQGKQTRTVTVYPLTRTDVVLGAETVARSIVIAPADDYLPAADVELVGTRLVIRHAGHEVIGRVGTTTYSIDKRSMSYDAPPSVIRSRIYLPLELLTMLTLNDKK
jgi:hypothetical protein